MDSIDYKQIVHDAIDCYWMIDAQTGTVVDANNAYCEVTGYDAGEVIGKQIADFEAVDSEDEVKARIETIVDRGSCTFIASHKTKTGEIVKLETTAKLRIYNGRSYIAAFMKDIDKSVSLDMYDVLVSSLHANKILIWRFDISENVIYYDDFTAGVLGYKPQTLAISYDKYISMVHPDDVQKVSDAVEEQLLKNNNLTVDFRLQRYDGTWLWLECRGRVVKYDENGKPHLAVGTYTDIQERKNIEKRLLENEEKLRQINVNLMELVRQESSSRVAKELAFASVFEAFGIGVLILDENKNIIDANKQLLKMYGIDKKEDVIGDTYMNILDKKERELADKRLSGVMHQANTHNCFCNCEGDVANEQKGAQYEVTIKTAHGTTLEVLVNTACFKNNNNEINYVFSLTDITQMRELERKQKENEKLLVSQSRMAAMGEMIGAIAHQWRQPLNILGIMVQDIPYMLHNGGIDDTYAEQFEKRAMKQIGFMSKTIDDFRNFFRSDKYERDFCFNKQIKDSLSLVGDMFKAHGIEIVITESEPEIIAKGYPNELGQVVLNIASNAKDAISELGGNKKNKLTINITKDDKYAIATIADSAGGIPEKIIDRIFEPYFTTKPEGKGTGIGLYMSKTIVEQNMNGKLSVKNENGGAVFTVKIPLAQIY